MKIRRPAVLLSALLVVLLLIPVLSAAAQSSRTTTLTEAQINSSYAVTNPARRGVTNLSVDLQPGAAVISSTHTVRTRGQNQTFTCSSTWTPGITNGVVTWTLGSATCNGTAASQQLIGQINSSIGSSWRTYWRNQRGGRVTNVTVSADSITYTWQ